MYTVILAGGLGTRLSEETQVKPKPMVEIGGIPILVHLLRIYAHFGHKQFFIALGYKGEVIKDYFLNYRARSADLIIKLRSGIITYARGEMEDWTLHLVNTGEKTMTGGRLRRLQSQLQNKGTFMATYGDGLGDINIPALLRFHKSHGKLATVTAVRPPARFGTMVFDGNRVTDFKEKPQAGAGWINGGFFVFEPAVFNYIEGDSVVLEQSPLESLAQDGELMAYKHEGFWHPMDTIRDRDALNDIWGRGEAPWKWKD